MNGSDSPQMFRMNSGGLNTRGCFDLGPSGITTGLFWKREIVYFTAQQI